MTGNEVMLGAHRVYGVAAVVRVGVAKEAGRPCDPKERGGGR